MMKQQHVVTKHATSSSRVGCDLMLGCCKKGLLLATIGRNAAAVAVAAAFTAQEHVRHQAAGKK
jgi:hypothetical protein